MEGSNIRDQPLPQLCKTSIRYEDECSIEKGGRMTAKGREKGDNDRINTRQKHVCRGLLKRKLSTEKTKNTTTISAHVSQIVYNFEVKSRKRCQPCHNHSLLRKQIMNLDPISYTKNKSGSRTEDQARPTIKITHIKRIVIIK